MPLVPACLSYARRFAARPLLVTLLAVACAAPAAPTPTPDPFAALRPIAQDAYEAGSAALQRGELETALVELNRAKVNDPDNRADIEQALQGTLRLLRARTPTPTLLPTRTPAPTDTPSPPLAAPAEPTSRPPQTRPSAEGTRRFRDTAGRFTLDVPADWQQRAAPPSASGTGVIGFTGPGGATFTVAVDQATQTVSPELYAARMELQLQRTPGYALELVTSNMLAGSPSVRRDFSLGAGDAGASPATRGFQVVVVRAQTPYLLEALAPQAEYEALRPTFERMLESFRFA